MLNSIKFNPRKGDSIKINATKSFMRGVEQDVAGGTIEHCATEELTQIDNTMEASDGGTILNEVEGGKLNQQGNQMKATKKGVITNKVSPKVRTAMWIVLIGGVVGAIGFLADSTSLFDRFSR